MISPPQKNENKVEKPVMVLRREFINNLASLVKQSGLALLLIEPILRDALNDINNHLKNEEKLEFEEYNKLLNKKEE